MSKTKTCPNRLRIAGWIYSGWGDDKKRCKTCGGTGVVSK